jgi:hypothetical protein
MAHHDSILKAYAEIGLRSAAEWASRGRDLADGAQPRARTDHRVPTELYSREQTRARVSPRRAGGRAGIH